MPISDTRSVPQTTEACNRNEPSYQTDGNVLTDQYPSELSKWIPDGYKSRFEAFMAVARYGSDLLGEAEFKVLLFIAERTAGWGKPSDTCSYDQLVNGIARRNGGGYVRVGCGLKKSAAAKAIKTLVNDLQVLKREQVKSENGGDSATKYTIQWATLRTYFDQELAQYRVHQEAPPVSSKKTPPRVHQEDTQSRTNHHQQSRSLQGVEVLEPVHREQRPISTPASSEGTPVPKIKPTAKPFLNGDDEKPKAKAKPSRDGDTDSLLLELRDANPSTDQEARELTRKVMAMGKERDIENTIVKMQKALYERDGAFIQLWQKVKSTGNPRAVSGGFYVQLAKDLTTEIQVSILQLRTQSTALRMPGESKHNHVCRVGNGCNSKGLLPDGRYCTCKLGVLASQVANHSKMPPASILAENISQVGAA